MPQRVWTAEQKKAASDRAKARLAASRGAAVAEREDDDEGLPEVLRPDGTSQSPDDVGSISRNEMFIAHMKAQQPITTTDDLASFAGEDRDMLEEGAGSNVEHRSAGLVWMFKRETWGWHRIKVSRNSVTDLIGAGLRDRCGDCGSTKCAGEINACPKGKKVSYRDCPVVGCNDGRPKRIFDVLANTNNERLADDDPFAIRDDAYGLSTPETRTKAALDAHIRAYHETEANARGLMNITRAGA